MTSPEKAAANRENCKKSTGPRSTEGKARSARNALTHGLTAEPGDPTEAYRENLAEWVGDLKSKGIAERTLAERACRAAWSLKRCDRYEDATAAKRDRDAAEMFDLAEAERAAAIGRRLVAMPVEIDNHDGSPGSTAGQARTDDADPAALVGALRATAAGVAWLLARWSELGRALDEPAGWGEDHKFAAARLLGLSPESARAHPLGRRIYPPPISLGPIAPRGSVFDMPEMHGVLEKIAIDTQDIFRRNHGRTPLQRTPVAHEFFR